MLRTTEVKNTFLAIQLSLMLGRKENQEMLPCMINKEGEAEVQEEYVKSAPNPDLSKNRFLRVKSEG